MPEGIAIFLGLVVVYGAFAVWLGRFSITMPIIFVAVGAILGPHGLVEHKDVELLTEMTLALLLFADASTLSFRQVRDDARLPARLLIIAMPLIIALGGLVAYGLFPGERVGFALLLAAILAPTDAALGLPIFNNPRVPVRVRRALNVESGLNDGIATPLVALFAALALAQETQQAGGWLTSALSEIGIGVGVGVAAGLLGVGFLRQRSNGAGPAQPGNRSATWRWRCALSGRPRLWEATGFVAAFLGGLLFGYATRERLHVASEFTETTGTLLSLFVWAVFGANLVPPLLQSFNPLTLLYALLSLTVIRMVPVAVSLLGTRLRADTALIMGWFGPRGLASVVFTLMAYESFHEAGRGSDLLVDTAAWTILLSVLLHGVSAVPLANWYSRRLQTADPETPELVELPELGIRRRDPLGWLRQRPVAR